MKTTEETTTAAPIVPPRFDEIPVAKIRPDPNNRKGADLQKLKALAASIDLEGLQQPIVVRCLAPDEGGGSGAEFQIVSGERRWLAHKELKRANILARVLPAPAKRVEGGTPEHRVFTAARAVENLQREDLAPLAQAQLYADLATAGHTQTEIARMAGTSQPDVANTLALLKLPPKVRDLIAADELTAAHGKVLGRFRTWPKVCERIAELAIKRGTTSKELEEEALPFDYELNHAKLVVEIETKPNSWEHKPAYKVPPALAADQSAFLKQENGDWFCFEPAKWAPEKAKQDAVFAALQKKGQAAEGALQSKMTPAAKAARKKVIADNKRNRTETAARTTQAIARLKGQKSLDKAALAVALEKVLADHHYRSRITDAAKQLGIALPKGLVTSSWFSLVSFAKLLELSETDMVRLTAAAVALHHSECALKNASGVPEEVSRLLRAKKGRP